MLHGVAAIVSFVFLVGACLTLGWRCARQRQWGWALYGVATGIVSVALLSG